MKGEKYYNWKRMRTTPGRFDDGSVLRIVKTGRGKYCYIQIRKTLLKDSKEGDRVVLYYSGKGYLGIKLEDSTKYNSYYLRESTGKNYFSIRGGIISRFSPMKYFENSVEREGDMVIIKVELADEKRKITTLDLISEDKTPENKKTK